MLSTKDFLIGMAVGFPIGILFTALVIRYGPQIIMSILWSWSACSFKWIRRPKD